MRIWRDSFSAPPGTASTWTNSDNDFASPDVTFTNPGANAVDTGNYVGFGSRQSASGDTEFDVFRGGDVPHDRARLVSVSPTANTDGSHDVLYYGLKIGTSTGGTPQQPLVVTFSDPSSATVTKTMVEAVLKNLCFFNTATTPDNTTRVATIVMLASDGTALSSTETCQVSSDCPTGVDVILVIDKSYSMVTTPYDETDPTGPTRRDAAGSSAISFLSALQFDKDDVEVLSFYGEPGVSTNPTHESDGFLNNATALTTDINHEADTDWDDHHSTVYHPTLAVAHTDLNAIANSARLPMIVFLTDGLIDSSTVNDDPYYTKLAIDQADLLVLVTTSG